MPIDNINWDIFGDGHIPEPAQEQLNAAQDHLVGMGPAVVNWGEANGLQGGYALPQLPPNQLNALNQALGGNNPYVKYYKDKDMFTSKKSKTMATPSISQLSDEYRALTYQITELQGSLTRESEELASVLEKIATQVEVVKDIGSLIHTRISSLQKAANQLENWRLSLPQPSSPGSETRQSASRYEPAPALQPAQAGQVQVGPGLWQQDQV